MSDDRSKELATEPDPYPTLTKIKSLEKESDAIGGFLEWCEGEGIILSRYKQYEDRVNPILEPIHVDISGLIGQHFGIDMAAAERERMDILRQLRQQ